MFQKINEEGITLVEIIVSLAILGVIIVPLSTLFMNSVRNNVMAEDRLLAAQIAQDKMEELMHEKALLPDENTETDGRFSITYSIENYSGGVDNTTGTLITDYDAEVSFDGITGTIDLRGEDSPVYMYIEDHTIMFNRDLEKQGQIAIQNFTSTEDVKIKMYYDNTQDMNIKVYNKTTIPVKIYKIYKTDIPDYELSISTEYGKVYTYEHIFEALGDTESSEEKYRTYKITVAVSKNGEELARIISLKTMD